MGHGSMDKSWCPPSLYASDKFSADFENMRAGIILYYRKQFLIGSLTLYEFLSIYDAIL